MLSYTKSLTLAVSLVLIASLALATTAGAKTINGTKKNDVLVGTKKADRIDGKAGDDKISGKAGNDTLTGGKGKDKINAGTGNDKIKVKDGKVDSVTCGPGKDTVTSDAIDKLAVDCEATPAPVPMPTPTPTAVITLIVNGGGTVSSSPTGINCGAICAGTFNVGTSVTLTATPGANQEFAGWGGACTGTGTCVLTADISKGVTASFVPVKHALSVSLTGGGSGSIASTPAGINCPGDCSENFDHGTTVSLAANPVSGAEFTGWSGACTGTGTCEVTMDAAKSVSANFELIQYTVTAVKSGTGSGTVTSTPSGINCGVDCTEVYNHGTSLTLTAAADAGSTFAGWSGSGCTGTGSCVVSVAAAATVTATFTLDTHTLTVSKTGAGSGTVTSSPAGINCGADCTENFDHNTLVTLTPTPASGSEFTGWTGACTGTGSCAVTMDAAKSVNANFEPSQYTLTTVKTGAGTGSVTSTPSGINCGVDCSEIYNHGTSVTLTAAANVGSTFAGWSGACTGTGSCTVTLTAASTVTATFTPTFNTLSVVKAGSGSGTVTSAPAGINCGVDCDEAVSDGMTITLTAATSVGSTFTGWSGGGCTGTGTCTVTPTSATTVTATFTLSTYTLTASKTGAGAGTVTSAPSGINCGADCDEVYDHGTSVTLTALAGVGSAFAGWSGGCTGTGTCVVSMTAANSVTASFVPSFNVLTVSKSGTGAGTVTSAPSGINCGADCSEVLAVGQTMTLTASASIGSTFVGWSGGGCTGTGTCVVTPTSATTVTATFTLQTYPLSVAKTGSGSGFVTSSPAGIACGGDCTESINHGTTVTLTAAPAIGSTFVGWSGAGCTGTGTCTVTMTAATTVTATFIPSTHTLSVGLVGTGDGNVTSSPTGITCGVDCTETYPYGTTVTLTADADFLSSFDGWLGACSGTSTTCVVPMTEARNVTAIFN